MEFKCKQCERVLGSMAQVTEFRHRPEIDPDAKVPVGRCPDCGGLVFEVSRPEWLLALEAFIDTIKVTGGVVEFEDGTFGCAGDEEWLDMAEAYLLACHAIGVEPVIQKEA